ncbi:16S rRNA (uracil(1498)-N(3))-methyltransferase [bacterium]|nr:16S rRNA (uracil(1498)-N(3))-methyltransferase [bacterium]
MQLFYSTSVHSEIITLDENDSKHAIRVLRLNENDKIDIIDGVGTLYHCAILDAHPKRCTLRVLESKKDENPYGMLHIAVAPTKNNNRYEWFIEKATEIGIGSITPIVTENSERRVIKHDRMEKILIAAMKQSLKLYLPELKEVQPFKSAINQFPESNRLIAHCAFDLDKNKLIESIDTTLPTYLMIGPEGDFSAKEIEIAKMNGFKPVSLGKSRLRTETAAVVACAQLNMRYE